MQKPDRTDNPELPADVALTKDGADAAVPAPPDATESGLDTHGALRPSNNRDILFALLGVAAVSVLVAFDSTIVTTTLPRVAEALDGMALYAWAGSGYLLTMAVTIPVFGRLGDMFGRKRLMLLSVLIVALCSIACGLAQTMPQLVIARMVQGVGGGMMIATAFAAPADLLPDPNQRVRWMALLSATFAVASGIGPILGGTITEAFGWRMAFMAAPVAAVLAFWMVWRYLPDMRPPQVPGGQRIDWLGGALLIFAVGGPLAALQFGFSGQGLGWLAVALGMIGVIALVVLVPYERRVSMPMLPMRVLSGRDPRLLNVAGLLVGAVMFNLVYYGPLLLQNVLMVSPARAGLLMTPLVASIPAGSILNSYLFPRQSQPQRLMVLGAGLLAIACLGTMALSPGVSAYWAMLAFGLAGVGLGLLLPNLTMFMQMMSDPRDVGVASALIQTTRAVGSAAGIALVGVLITRTSVLTGVRLGMIGSVVGCILVALLALRMRMRNVGRS